jgi:hypothetical protein
VKVALVGAGVGAVLGAGVAGAGVGAGTDPLMTSMNLPPLLLRFSNFRFPEFELLIKSNSCIIISFTLINSMKLGYQFIYNKIKIGSMKLPINFP